MDIFIWIGLIFCLSQSAIFSGLNLAFFSLTRLRLEIEADDKKLGKAASRILKMRKDSNFLLTTILWGNVGINVLLTLLSDSVLAGVAAFAFSTIFITLFGEIIPQAYFSRNALRMASLLTPVLQFYQILLYPVAKPSAILLDKWLGKEAIQYFHEEKIKQFIQKHIDGHGNEIDHVEGRGAINFFTVDDLSILQEGEIINKYSIVALPMENGKLIFPDYKPDMEDSFLKKVNKSGKNWIVLVDVNNFPQLVLDADALIRSAVFSKKIIPIEKFCYEPIIITNPKISLGILIKKLKENIEVHSDLPLEKDVIIFWGKQKRIITGSDILGQLLKGIQ